MLQLSKAELATWQADNRPFQLIDVREPAEHAAFNIGGELIPLGEIMQQAERLDTSLPIVVYCKRGLRSQLAIQRWQARFPQAQFYNLAGGIGLGPQPEE